MIEFLQITRDRIGFRGKFNYPPDGLLPVTGIMSADEIRHPKSEDCAGDSVRYVIKHGSTTNITVGVVSGFMSHVRRYSVLGPIDSVEVAILPHHEVRESFSERGDSGSLIVDTHGKAVALLSGQAGKNCFPDITFGTPMEWVWSLIKAQYPDANFDFDNLEAFFSDVA
jgi:hypothetical protein